MLIGEGILESFAIAREGFAELHSELNADAHRSSRAAEKAQCGRRAMDTGPGRAGTLTRRA